MKILLQTKSNKTWWLITKIVLLFHFISEGFKLFFLDAGNNYGSSLTMADEVKSNQESAKSSESSLEDMVSRKLKAHPTHRIRFTALTDFLVLLLLLFLSFVADYQFKDMLLFF